MLCSAHETAGTPANLMAAAVVVVSLPTETLTALADFVAVVIIMIHVAEEAFPAGAGLLATGIKMLVAAPKVPAGPANHFAVFIIVDDVSEKTFLAVSALCHNVTS